MARRRSPVKTATRGTSSVFAPVKGDRARLGPETLKGLEFDARHPHGGVLIIKAGD